MFNVTKKCSTLEVHFHSSSVVLALIYSGPANCRKKDSTITKAEMIKTIVPRENNQGPRILDLFQALQLPLDPIPTPEY